MSQPPPIRIPQELLRGQSLEVQNYFKQLTNAVYQFWASGADVSVSLLNSVVDLTDETSDYELSVGETAKITISSNSAALNIDSTDGAVYDLTFLIDPDSVSAATTIGLLVNNNAALASFSGAQLRASDGLGSDEVDVQEDTAWGRHFFSAFQVIPIHGNARIIKDGLRSGCVSHLHYKDGSGNNSYAAMVTFWNDDENITSLGTFSMPTSGTPDGVIYVTRRA